MGGVEMTTRFFALALIAGVAACTELPAEEQGTTSRALSQGTGLSAGLVTGRIYDDLAANAADRTADFATLGVKMLRVEIENTTPLAKYKTIIEAAQSKGIEVLAIVGQNSVDGSPSPMAGSRADFDQTYVPRFMSALDTVLQAIPSLKYVEIWNEPDVYGFLPVFTWNPGSCRAEEGSFRYALLTVRVFETLNERRKNGQSTPKIAAFSFSRQDDGCLRSSVINAQPIAAHRKYYRPAAGLADGLPTDIVAIHAYGNAGRIPGEAGYTYAGGTFADGVTSFLGATFADGRSMINGAPVWYTELGFCRGGVGGADPRVRQATAIGSALNELAKHPAVTAAFVYAYRDDEAGGTEQCGLRASSAGGFAAHPAYRAFASFANPKAGK
jgi:hypothetical protein